MDGTYADLRPEPLPGHCVWRGVVRRDHDLWADENVCSRCGKTITEERREPMNPTHPEGCPCAICNPGGK